MSEFIDFRARVVRGVDGETTLYFFSADGRRASLTLDPSVDTDYGVTVALSKPTEPMPSIRELDSEGGLDAGDVLVALREMAEFCHETSAPAAVDRDAVRDEAFEEAALLCCDELGCAETIRALKSQPAKEPTP